MWDAVHILALRFNLRSQHLQQLGKPIRMRGPGRRGDQLAARKRARCEYSIHQRDLKFKIRPHPRQTAGAQTRQIPLVADPRVRYHSNSKESVPIEGQLLRR